MEIAAERPAPGELIPAPARPADLVRVGLSAATLFAAIGSVIGFAGLLLSSTDEFSDIAPFHGWQLWSMEGLFGAAFLAAVAVSTRWARRRYRAVRDRTPYRRAVVLAVVVPALAVGGFVGQAVKPALTWASNHTAAAATEQRQFAAFERRLQRAPLAAPVSQPLAADYLAKRLLRPADLGAGWYAGTQPNPTSRVVPPDAATAGATARAATFLTQAHRQGAAWSPEVSVLETQTRLGNSAQAAAYLLQVRKERERCSCADTAGVMLETRVHGTSVWQQISAGPSSRHLWAAFALHNRVYTLLIYRWQAAPGAVSLTGPVRLAVTRAAHPA